MSAKKRSLDKLQDVANDTKAKRQKTTETPVKMDGHYPLKPTKWICQKVWDFDKNGGLYAMSELDEAQKFWKQNGFAVIRDVIDEKENTEAQQMLLRDLKEINQNKKEAITNLNELSNKQLPGWASNGIRLQFGISHGEFANFSRLRPNIRKIFAQLHECDEKELNCSWDSIAVTPFNGKHRNTLWLHADQSIYDQKGKKIKGWDFLSVQGCLYYTESNRSTVSFVCAPGTHTKYWAKLAELSKTRTKHWLFIDQICRELSDNKEVQEITKDIMESAHRIHVPKNSFLVWNSKVFHQNGDALEAKPKETKQVKRIGSFICMAPNNLREHQAFKRSLVYAINGTTSTHWAQLMVSHTGKHPRFTKGNCYENMMDLKPKLNPNVSELQFQSLIPESLRDMKVKIYNTERTETLSMQNIHHLGNKDLGKFDVHHLWQIIHPSLKPLQPWIDP